MVDNQDASEIQLAMRREYWKDRPITATARRSNYDSSENHGVYRAGYGGIQICTPQAFANTGEALVLDRPSGAIDPLPEPQREQKESNAVGDGPNPGKIIEMGFPLAEGGQDFEMQSGQFLFYTMGGYECDGKQYAKEIISTGFTLDGDHINTRLITLTGGTLDASDVGRAFVMYFGNPAEVNAMIVKVLSATQCIISKTIDESSGASVDIMGWEDTLAANKTNSQTVQLNMTGPITMTANELRGKVLVHYKSLGTDVLAGNPNGNIVEIKATSRPFTINDVGNFLEVNVAGSPIFRVNIIIFISPTKVMVDIPVIGTAEDQTVTVYQRTAFTITDNDAVDTLTLRSKITALADDTVKIVEAPFLHFISERRKLPSSVVHYEQDALSYYRDLIGMVCQNSEVKFENEAETIITPDLQCPMFIDSVKEETANAQGGTSIFTRKHLPSEIYTWDDVKNAKCESEVFSRLGHFIIKYAANIGNDFLNEVTAISFRVEREDDIMKTLGGGENANKKKEGLRHHIIKLTFAPYSSQNIDFRELRNLKMREYGHDLRLIFKAQRATDDFIHFFYNSLRVSDYPNKLPTQAEMELAIDMELRLATETENTEPGHGAMVIMNNLNPLYYADI